MNCFSDYQIILLQMFMWRESTWSDHLSIAEYLHEFTSASNSKTCATWSIRPFTELKDSKKKFVYATLLEVIEEK